MSLLKNRRRHIGHIGGKIIIYLNVYTFIYTVYRVINTIVQSFVSGEKKMDKNILYMYLSGAIFNYG